MNEIELGKILISLGISILILAAGRFLFRPSTKKNFGELPRVYKGQTSDELTEHINTAYSISAKTRAKLSAHAKKRKRKGGRFV